MSRDRTSVVAKRRLEGLDRDVNKALAFLIDHQDEWEPTIVTCPTISHGASGSPKGSGGARELPLTLIPQVRS